MVEPVRALVVSWNGAHLLPSCLSSLEQQTVRDRMEVVVVDNASTDGTEDLMARRHPAVRVIRSAVNLGFAGGAELGMRDAPGHVVLLNNDARFAPDAVERLLDALDGFPRAGAVTAKILLADPSGGEPRWVNSTGNVVTTRGAGGDRDWMRPRGQESTERTVFGFCGGAALLRREALDDVGGFDPSLFLYYEDTDLSWRMRAAGWEVVHEPAAVAVHQHAASSGTDSPLFRYHNTRNSLVVVTRHAPARVVLRSVVRQSAGAVRAVLRAGTSSAVARARLRALRDYALRLPRTLRERRALWRNAAVDRASVARHLSPPGGD
ncbi:glycosyltransferase family 2 protein [Cellulomonas sp.]|uniref:glycosyltransferase family 2 protein n=1 Tax=Cellulomonas sp. TaxID=40001 RepID=UPI002810F1B0|nr:glycosyltransferase family 2 protein [Cellulomonas sp.]